MDYRQTIEGCFGDGPAALSEQALTPCLAAAGDALTHIRDAFKAGSMPFLAQPSRRDDLKDILGTAEYFCGTVRRVVVLGTGGSSLGGQALVRLAQSDVRTAAAAPRLIFVDNADSERLAPLLGTKTVRESGFVAISKSGATTETVAQLLLAVDAIREAESATALATRIAVVTEPDDRPLRRLAKQFSMPVIDHPADVGGRFSALTVSRLLPAAIAGLDVAAIRDGARPLVDALDDASAKDYPPALGAALSIALAPDFGCTQSVLMPYGDSLRPFASWWRQLWAESLGKDGAGTTPINALGALDQHSQLQLYLDGPADKMFTVIGAASPEADPAVAPDLTNDPELGYLGGRSLSDILLAMRRATMDTLRTHGRPVRYFELERLDGAATGALMMHFMIETVIAAQLLKVDPFGQPAVEDGKRRARAILSKGADI